LGNLKGRLMRNQVVKGKILRHFPGITWRDWGKPQNPQSGQLAWDLNLGPPEYEAEVLTSWLQCLVINHLK
jgi:hypothetical protein